MDTGQRGVVRAGKGKPGLGKSRESMGITWEEGFLEEGLSVLGFKGQGILLECLVGGGEIDEQSSSRFRMGRRREHESLSLGTGVNPESRIYSKEMREEEREGHVCVHSCEEAWGGVHANLC